VDYQIGTLQDGVNRLERALQLLPVGRSKQRSVLLGNAAMMRWWLNGDSDMYIAARAAQLNDSDDLPPGRETDHCWNLGITALMSGALEEARGWFARGAKPDPANALYALHCQIFLMIAERRYAQLPELLARLEVWNNPALDDRALSFWAFALLNDGRAAEALAKTRGRDGELLGLIGPLILHANGERDLALRSLPEPVDAATYRETALLIQAVRYRVTRDPLELERLIGLNVEGERVLAYYVPVAELPRHRPELSRHHNLHAVLESGWKEAILLRLDELPALQVRLLGRVEVFSQGQPVALSARLRDALTLLALRLPREQIAEELWRDLEPEKSRNNLHVTLNALRKLLEPWAVPTYLLESGLKRTVCDLWQLEAALDESDAVAVQRLYADLAPGVDARALDERREHLRGRAIRTVLSATSDDLEARLEWVLRHDPLHEEAMLRLLELLRRSGRRVTAARRLQEFARTLRDEIGVEPSAALQAALNLG
jgi:DNA-binding SARP family transcriptional activator